MTFGSPSCSVTAVYPWNSTIPGFQVTVSQMEESYPAHWEAPWQPFCGMQEEAQGKTSDEANWVPFLITEATQAVGNGPWWHYTQTFLRRPANQGQGFRLQTEFELNEAGSYPPPFGESFDNVVGTQRSESY